MKPPDIPQLSAVIAPITWSAEVRSSKATTRTVEGHAAVFNSPTTIGSFRERIMPGAFRKALAAGRDIPLVYGHDQDKLLASTKNGSLTLSEDSRGLKIRATIVGTSLGDDIVTLVREGLADRMSFAFTVASGGDTWRLGSDGVAERAISEVSALFDVSIVTTPAYDEAEVALAEARGATARGAVGDTALALVAARDAVSARAARVAGAPSRVTEVRERGAYGPDSPHSFFRDLALVSQVDKSKRDLATAIPWGEERARKMSGDMLASSIPGHSQGGYEEARARLASVQTRDSTTADGSLGAMAGSPVSGMPGFIRDHWGKIGRARAHLLSAIPTEPMPKGVRTDVPRLLTGVTAGTVVSENTAVPEQDAVTHAGTLSPTATIAGLADLSQQTLDLSGGLVDLVITGDLSAAMAEVAEQQVINGTAAAAQTRGLLAWSGTNSYTAGTISVDSNWSRYVNARAAHEIAWGQAPDLVLLHPRRLAYLEQGAGTLGALPWRATLVTSNQVPTNYGAGGTQDPVILVNREELVAYDSGPHIRVNVDWQGAGNFTVRIVGYRWLSMEILSPKAVSCLSGYGLSTPAFA